MIRVLCRSFAELLAFGFMFAGIAVGYMAANPPAPREQISAVHSWAVRK